MRTPLQLVGRNRPDTVARATARGAVRGAMAAMAMTGMRSVTRELGLLDESPPDAIFGDKPIGPLARIPERYRPLATEVAHWGYGAAGGAAFVHMPAGLRHHRWAGLWYGLVVWGSFEATVAPVLLHAQHKKFTVTDRAMIALDHVLYGAIVAGSRWPQQV